MVSKTLPDRKSQFLHYILRFFDQLCSLLDERVAAPGERRMYRPGNGKHFPPLLQRLSGSDQRSALQGRLYHKATTAHAADDPIATRKIASNGWSPKRKLRHKHTLFRELMGKFSIRRRIDFIQTGSYDSYA